MGAWPTGDRPCWHAHRHTERLVWPLRSTSPGGRTWPAVRRFAHAALPTLVTLTAVVVLAGGDPPAVAVSAALAVLVALTFPHVRTVQALDRWAAAQVRTGR